MKKRVNVGPLRLIINRYLKLKRSMGSALRVSAYVLYHFNRYLAGHFPDAQYITRAMVFGYLQTIRHLHVTTRKTRLSYIRQLCRFQFQLNPKTYIPEGRLLRPGRETKWGQHIYSEEELQNILRLANRPKPFDPLRPHTLITLFSLLWVSGMRISEVLKLNLEDVDLAQGIIHIRQTKFLKSRLIPLSRSSTSALSRYLKKRRRYGFDEDPTAPFFVNKWAKRRTKSRWTYTPILLEFQSIVRQLGIKNPRGRDPRLHDFRHTFATRWLSKFYRSGRDPAVSLPILATYLGHVDIYKTQIYLHPSMELLQTAARKFNTHIRQSRAERTKP